MTGDQFASIVHGMLLDLGKAVSIPLVVSSAATGDYSPLKEEGLLDPAVDLNLMGSSIWCNEPWTGLDAKGPWGTDFDSYTAARIAAFRNACSSVPKRGEPRSHWTLPAPSPVPVLALVGGADPSAIRGNRASVVADSMRWFYEPSREPGSAYSDCMSPCRAEPTSNPVDG